MKSIKKIIFNLLFIPLISFSQNPDEMFARDMGFSEKVLINNKFKSFSVGIKETINGNETEIEYFRNDLDDPFLIEIQSTKDFGKIIINNSSLPKTFEVKFSSIFKKNKDKEITYFFATNNPNSTIYYSRKIGQNDTLIITLKKNSDNSIMYLYTISKL